MKSKEAIVNEKFQLDGFYAIRIMPQDKERIYDAMDEYAKQEAIAYEAWKSKLTPTQLCTVHPPSGSGGSIGLYHKTDDDLWQQFLQSKKQ